MTDISPHRPYARQILWLSPFVISASGMWAYVGYALIHSGQWFLFGIHLPKLITLVMTYSKGRRRKDSISEAPNEMSLRSMNANDIGISMISLFSDMIVIGLLHQLGR
jgi:hypothetical protein